MEMSTAIDKIAPAFVKAQEVIEDPEMNAVNSFVKKADGSFHRYADLTAILKICRAELTKNGIAVMQTTATDEQCLFITIQTTLLHTSGQWFRGDVTVPLGGKRDAQAVGSCITYGRRYGLAAIMGIAQQEDDDGDTGSKKRDGAGREQNAETHSGSQKRQKPESAQKQRQAERQAQASDPTLIEPISDNRLAYLEELILITKSDMKHIARWAKVAELKSLMNGEYPKVRDTLEQKALNMGIEELPVRPAEDKQTEAA